MARKTWIGGATAVQQVTDFALTQMGATKEAWTWTITNEVNGTSTVVKTDIGPISIVNNRFAWTASGTEDYLRTAELTDPGITTKPDWVQEGVNQISESVVGSLTAGEWGYGDNNSLGYNTIYVFTTGGAQPTSINQIEYLTIGKELVDAWNADSTAASFATATLIRPITEISVRNSNYSWTAGGGGTNEFYLKNAGGGNANPFIGGAPLRVEEDGDELVKASLGGRGADSLAVGEYDYADSDSLGYKTLYIRRLAGNSTDPDTLSTDAIKIAQYTPTIRLSAKTTGVPFTAALASAGTAELVKTTSTANSGPNDANTAANYIEGKVLATDDDLLLTGSNSILYGLQQGSVEIDTLDTDGFTGAVGTAGTYLVLDLGASGDSNTGAAVDWGGTGRAWLDFGNSDIPVVVRATNRPATGYGLSIKGTDLSTVTVSKGIVGIGVEFDDTATVVATVNVNYINSLSNDAQVTLGSGVGSVGTTTANVYKTGGKVTVECALTGGLYNDAGTAETKGSGAIGTLEVQSGTVICNSSGTITTLNLKGGIANFLRNQTARTITNVKMWPGSQFLYDPAIMTLTNDIVSGDTIKPLAVSFKIGS